MRRLGIWIPLNASRAISSNARPSHLWSFRSSAVEFSRRSKTSFSFPSAKTTRAFIGRAPGGFPSPDGERGVFQVFPDEGRVPDPAHLALCIQCDLPRGK